jgi:3-hydroxyisobutyrate dehydrogenase
MAGRLLEKGHQLHVYNRTRARAEPLTRLGAVLFETPKAACESVDGVIAMVADDPASRDVWLGPDGILSADLAAGRFAMECSTLSHEWVAALSKRCKTRGLRYIDAPVTGLPDAAAAGELTLLVGADADDLAVLRPVLDSLASKVIRFGPVGAGTAYKLIVNMIGAVQIASAAEGLAIAERAGLDVAEVTNAIATSQAASPQVLRNTLRMAGGDHDRPIVFSGNLRMKDVEYGVKFAQSLGIGSPFGVVAQATYRALCEMGYGQLNESKVIEACRARLP